MQPLVRRQLDQARVVRPVPDDRRIGADAARRERDRRHVPSQALRLDRLDLRQAQVRAQQQRPFQQDLVPRRRRQRARRVRELEVDGWPYEVGQDQERARQPLALRDRRDPPLDSRLGSVLEPVAFAAQRVEGRQSLARRRQAARPPVADLALQRPDLARQRQEARERRVLFLDGPVRPKELAKGVEPLTGEVAHLPGHDVELVRAEREAEAGVDGPRPRRETRGRARPRRRHISRARSAAPN